jgi:TRAP-type C4-dicarboxylate transport system permease small subunit
MKSKGVLQPEESNTVFDRILEITSTLAMAMILFAMLSLCAHVFMRYVFDKPLNWTIDVASIFLLYITILAAAWLQKSDGHVAIDFLFTYLGRKAQLKLHLFNAVVCVIAFVIVIVFGVKETILVYQMDLYADMPLEPPKWILVVSIPIGITLLLIQYLRRIRSLVKKLKSPDEQTEENPA